MNIRRSRTRGFTLLEVLIALAIVAVSAGALLGTVTSSASNVIYLKDKTLAEWVALNRLAEIRTAQNLPSTGRRKGNVVMGGMRWEWEEEVTEMAMEGMLRVDVRAHNLGEPVDDSKPVDKPTSQTATPSSSSGTEMDKVAWTSTVIGVVGSSTSERRQPIGAPFTGNLSNNPGGQPGGQPGGPGNTPTPPQQPRTGAPSS
jgi:general secretion pathway protein I